MSNLPFSTLVRKGFIFTCFVYFIWDVDQRTYFACRKGSVKADILVKTFEDKDDSVEKTLKAELDKAKIGNIPVDRYKYSFEPTQGMKH